MLKIVISLLMFTKVFLTSITMARVQSTLAQKLRNRFLNTSKTNIVYLGKAIGML